MRRCFDLLYLLPFAWCSNAAAQELPAEIPDTLSSASGIASAAQTLSASGTDKLLIKDLIGKTLTGVDGKTVGTIENFAVIPGGRIAAALVSTENGSKIAVPYAAITVANAAGATSLRAEVPATELTGMSELKSLADSMTN